MAVPAPSLELPELLSKSLGRGHPWVYRDHVPRGTRLADGSLVRVVAGDFSAWGIWDASSAIAVRLLSATRRPDAAWVAERVRDAWALREAIRGQRTDAFRWIFGEGDGLPGISVDYYAGFAVIVTYADGLRTLLPWVVDALAATTELAGIAERREGKLELLRGRLPAPAHVIEEHGVKLRADLESGQKTGLFLDHRDNRRLVASLAPGRDVLNLFAYTGAFSIHAALAGARSVVSVDRAGSALAAARDNFVLNGLDPAAHELIEADVFAYLERANSQARRFELVICDPPSFARSKQQLPAALKAYARLNAAALRVSAPLAYYAAASCTAQLGHDAFLEMLAEAARRAKRRLQIIHDAGHAADHPVMAAHPEGRYLKFVVGRVLDAR
jgi:23S rRNA (cytosine1962-C5)-methyltransferase